MQDSTQEGLLDRQRARREERHISSRAAAQYSIIISMGDEKLVDGLRYQLVTEIDQHVHAFLLDAAREKGYR